MEIYRVKQKQIETEISQRAFNPHKISFGNRGSTGFFSSFRYNFMLYFSYKINRSLLSVFSCKVYRDILKFY